MPFRLHIDIPLGENEVTAKTLTMVIVQALRVRLSNFNTSDRKGELPDIKKLQYRLSHDDDRAKRNYLVKDENGHVSTKKMVEEIEA